MATLQPKEVDYVIYHHPCTDGFGSAFIAWKYLSTNFPQRQVIYYPAAVGSNPPNDLTGRNVLICDFSYRYPVLMEMLGKVKKLLILDHHKSSQKELANVPNEYKVFDMGHSGVGLTWKYFFPKEPVPRLVEYIQDRDLWTNQLPHIHEFAAWFYLQPFDFAIFNKYLDPNLLEHMMTTRGTAYLELNEFYIRQAVEAVAIRFTKINGFFYVVGYVNSTLLKSEIGNRIVTTFPQVDFAAVYTVDDQAGTTRFSLRSTDQQADVSIISTSLGGGGHRNASGVIVQAVVNHLPGTIYEFKHLYKQLQKITVKSMTFPGVGTLNGYHLHSPVHPGKLAKYLIQPKLGPGSMSVARSLLAAPNPETPDVAIVWDYDPVANETTFIVAFPSTLAPGVVQQLTQSLKLDPTLQVVHSGCHQVLPI
jgi:oligoribonuclease NrnB/cAMP/cGMP phosphodiesterase (DHH superfamily)